MARYTNGSWRVFSSLNPLKRYFGENDHYRPSFFRGTGSVMNVGGTLHCTGLPLNWQKADQKALEDDLKAIGRDFYAALK